MLSLSGERLKKFGDYDFIKNIQIITPTKKGELGTKELNKRLQQEINPQSEYKKEKKFGDSIFREGDRIMQIKNNYEIYWEKNKKSFESGSGIFNGEFGTIQKIDEKEKNIQIKFDDDKIAWYAFSELEQILIMVGNKNVLEFMIQNADNKKRNTGLTYKLVKLYND